MNSLERCCLTVIEENFDAYLAAYESKNPNYARLLEFLQRKYSSVLLYSLLPKRRLPPIGYTFLICDYLKELDLTYLNFCDPPFLIQRLSEVGKNIRILNMKNTDYSSVDIKKIVELVPNVEELNLAETHADDDVMKAIGCNKPLQNLDITACDISSAALEYLCERDDNGRLLRNFTLRRLGLTGPKGRGAFALKYFPSLQILEHFKLSQIISDIYEEKYLNRVLEVSPKFNLIKLKACNYFASQVDSEKEYNLAETLKRCAFLCPKVITLSLVRIVDPLTLQACTLFTNLQDVCLYSDYKIDFSPILESYYKSLKQITFSNGILSTDLLLKCRRLQRLTLWSVEVQPVTISTSESNKLAFKNMISLSFMFINLAEQMETTAFLISSSPNLQELEFSNCLNFDEAFVDCLCNCECIAKLVNLGLSRTVAAFNDILRIIFYAKSLKELDIQRSFFSRFDYRSIVDSIKMNGRSINVKMSSRYSSDSSSDSDAFSSSINSDDSVIIIDI